LLLLALTVTAAAQHKAKSSSSDKSTILALESAWNQAELHHDAAAAGAILVDTFISVDHHGQLQNRAEYIAGLKDTSFNPKEIANTETSFYVYGDTGYELRKTEKTDQEGSFLRQGAERVQAWLIRAILTC
jgi:hypothetical protein